MASFEIHFKHKILTIACILYVSLGVIFPLFLCYSDDEGRIIMFKEPVENMAMKNRVIRSEVVPSEGTCRVLCYLEPSCVSINLGPLQGGKYKCELNNVTDENQFINFLENEPTYTYLAIENPCSSSPCLNNGTCQAGFTSKGFRCLCRAGFNRTDFCHAYNCAEIYKSGERTNGVYTIKPDNLPAFDVFCDQTTAGGGWIVFQKRIDGSVDFFLNWNDYKHGFGDLNREFWLGNDKIHRLTANDNNVLRVDLEDFEGNSGYAEYDMFGIINENDKYRLMLGFYSGNATESLSWHRYLPFTTSDQDNDNRATANCAMLYHGAWWYGACHASNLNAIYRHSNPCPYGDGVIWSHWKGHYYSLKRTEMKIRPVDF